MNSTRSALSGLCGSELGNTRLIVASRAPTTTAIEMLFVHISASDKGHHGIHTARGVVRAGSLSCLLMLVAEGLRRTY